MTTSPPSAQQLEYVLRLSLPSAEGGFVGRSASITNGRGGTHTTPTICTSLPPPHTHALLSVEMILPASWRESWTSRRIRHLPPGRIQLTREISSVFQAYIFELSGLICSSTAIISLQCQHASLLETFAFEFKLI